MPDHLTIRVATPADADLVTSIVAAAYRTLVKADYDTAALAAALPAMSKANPKHLASGTYYIVEADGEPAGCGGWSFEAPGTSAVEPGVAHIRHFATHPDHLRKGVAGALLRHCLAEATKSGASVMRSQSTLLAEPFYAAAGFRRIAEVQAKMGDGVYVPAIDMERSLP